MTVNLESLASIGGYQILAKISSGGMGKVYLVRRSGAHRFEKLAAVKVVRSEKDNYQELRTMFLDEARLMARLSHPAIAQVYDFGEEHQRLFLVMEYVSGISFKDLIKRRPPSVIAAKAIAEVCLGLHVAHKLTDLSGEPMGVVHRDVSPQNLMLTFDGNIKILDFGIALVRDRETQATQLGQIKGKPAYMAPEQVTNQPIDRRTDVYAASLVLHELLTGRRVFTGDNLYSVAQAIMSAEIPPPSSLGFSLPEGLDQIVMQGLQREPDRRFQSAQEMAQALLAVVTPFTEDTLDRYAPDELHIEQAAHAEWLQAVLKKDLRGLPRDQISGRPPDVKTRPLGQADPGQVSYAQLTTQPSAGVDLRDTPAVSSRRRPSGLLLGLLAVLVLSLGGFLTYWYVLRDEPSPPPPAPSATPKDMQPEPVAVETAKVAEPEKKPPMKQPKRKSRKRRSPRRKPAKPDPAVITGNKVVEKPQTYGYITVAANPYANVRINGRELGTTPIIRQKIPAGEHQVTLVSPDTGEVRLSRKITVAENAHEKVILK